MGAGATYCCSQDERKNSFKAYINNFHLTGIEGLGDLGTSDCQSKYKNAFEQNLRISRDGLIYFYNDQMTHFSKVKAAEQNAYAKVNIKIIEQGAGLDD